MRYFADSITVDTDGTELDDTTFGFVNITYFTVWAKAAITIEIALADTYGEPIRVEADSGFDREVSANKLKIRAVSGTADVNYYVENNI